MGGVFSSTSALGSTLRAVGGLAVLELLRRELLRRRSLDMEGSKLAAKEAADTSAVAQAGSVRDQAADAGDATQVFTRRWLDDGGADLDGPSPSSPSAASCWRFRAMSFNLLADGLAKGCPPRDGEAELAGVLPPLPTPPLKAYYPDLSDDPSGDVGVLDGMRPQAPKGCAFVPEPYRLPEGEAQNSRRNYFFRCPEAVLEWNRRWPKLRALILEHEPDIVGLQEMDFEEDSPGHAAGVCRDLERAGYASKCLKKKGRACDGVGLLWKHSKFQAVGDVHDWKLKSVHVALGQVLEHVDGTRILVVVTHLKAGLTEEAEAERAAQADVLLRQIRKHRIPTLLLADLNCCHEPLLSEAGALEPQALSLLLQGGFRSAHGTVAGREPPFTLWGGWSSHDVAYASDWVLSCGKRLMPRRILSMPEAQEVLAFPDRLPNERYPSDHLPVVVDFDLYAQGTVPPTASAKDRAEARSEAEGWSTVPAAERRRGQRGPKRPGGGQGRGRGGLGEEEGWQG